MQNKIYISHKRDEVKFKFPKQVKEFLHRTLYMPHYKNDKQTVLLKVEDRITYVYEIDENYFLNLVERLQKTKNASDIHLPGAISYFPNNFWSGCSISLCYYSDMDLLIDFSPNGRKDLIAFKNADYYLLKSSGGGTHPPDQPLNNLAVTKGGELKTLLSDLIKDSASLDKDVLEEFKNLKNIDAGDYLVLDDQRSMLFLIKNNYVYLLITTTKGSTMSQILARQEVQNFFGKFNVENLVVQAVFRRPDKRLTVLFDDFMAQYSYSDFDKQNMAQLSDEFEMNTFTEISTAITFGNFTYILTKEFYQAFPTTNYSEAKINSIYSDLFKCTERPIVADRTKPTLRKYDAQSGQTTNTFTQSIPFKLIFQLIVISIVLTAAVISIVLIYTKKFSKNIIMGSSKKYDKKSFSGSSANLSTLFNLAKSSSEKASKDGVKSSGSKLNLPSKQSSILQTINLPSKQSSTFQSSSTTQGIKTDRTQSKLESKTTSSNVLSGPLSKLASSKLTSFKLTSKL